MALRLEAADDAGPVKASSAIIAGLRVGQIHHGMHNTVGDGDLGVGGGLAGIATFGPKRANSQGRERIAVENNANHGTRTARTIFIVFNQLS